MTRVYTYYRVTAKNKTGTVQSTFRFPNKSELRYIGDLLESGYIITGVTKIETDQKTYNLYFKE